MPSKRPRDAQPTAPPPRIMLDPEKNRRERRELRPTPPPGPKPADNHNPATPSPLRQPEHPVRGLTPESRKKSRVKKKVKRSLSSELRIYVYCILAAIKFRRVLHRKVLRLAHERLREKCAFLVQCCWRRHLQHLRIRNNEAARRIQRLVRVVQLVSRQRAIFNAILVQKYWRRYAARCLAVRLMRERDLKRAHDVLRGIARKVVARRTFKRMAIERAEREVAVRSCVSGLHSMCREERLEWRALCDAAAEVGIRIQTSAVTSDARDQFDSADAVRSSFFSESSSSSFRALSHRHNTAPRSTFEAEDDTSVEEAYLELLEVCEQLERKEVERSLLDALRSLHDELRWTAELLEGRSLVGDFLAPVLINLQPMWVLRRGIDLLLKEQQDRSRICGEFEATPLIYLNQPGHAARKARDLPVRPVRRETSFEGSVLQPFAPQFRGRLVSTQWGDYTHFTPIARRSSLRDEAATSTVMPSHFNTLVNFDRFVAFQPEASSVSPVPRKSLFALPRRPSLALPDRRTTRWETADGTAPLAGPGGRFCASDADDLFPSQLQRTMSANAVLRKPRGSDTRHSLDDRIGFLPTAPKLEEYRSKGARDPQPVEHSAPDSRPKREFKGLHSFHRLSIDHFGASRPRSPGSRLHQGRENMIFSQVVDGKHRKFVSVGDGIESGSSPISSPSESFVLRTYSYDSNRSPGPMPPSSRDILSFFESAPFTRQRLASISFTSSHDNSFVSSRTPQSLAPPRRITQISQGMLDGPS